MFKFWENLIRKKEKKKEKLQQENIESLVKRFKESPTYPDYPNILLFYQYFFEKLFTNYILPQYLEKYIPERPIILELGSYKSRILELLPEPLKEKIILSDINLEILKENPEGAKLNFNFDKIPIKENSLPLILGSNVFMHILGLGDIEEVLRVLKEDGEAIFIEDLSMYMPALALYYQKKGYKYVYFVYDPSEAKTKCFIFENEKFLKGELKQLIKNINLEKAKSELKENFSEDAVNLFEELEEAIKEKFYSVNPFKFSIILFALTNQVNSEFLKMDEEERKKAYNLKLGLNNFLISLRNIFEKYKSKEIKGWEDFLEDVKKDFEAKGIFIEYEPIIIETDLKEIEKWQEKVLEETDLELLTRNNPFWKTLREYKNLIIETLGLEIGYNGEIVSNIEGNLRYKALIIRIKKEWKR